jgi:hypothetical protein
MKAWIYSRDSQGFLGRCDWLSNGLRSMVGTARALGSAGLLFSALGTAVLLVKIYPESASTSLGFSTSDVSSAA